MPGERFVGQGSKVSELARVQSGDPESHVTSSVNEEPIMAIGRRRISPFSDVELK
jgi:hypothetical protein